MNAANICSHPNSSLGSTEPSRKTMECTSSTAAPCLVGRFLTSVTAQCNLPDSMMPSSAVLLF